MFKLFKVIFVFFIILSVNLTYPVFAKKAEKDDDVPSVDDAMIHPQGLLNDINSQRQKYEKDYDRAMNLFDSGKIDESIDILIRLDKAGHAGSKATLTAIKKQKPSLVKAGFDRLRAKEEMQENAKKAKTETKEESPAKNKAKPPKTANDILDEGAKIVADAIKNKKTDNIQENKKNKEKKKDTRQKKLTKKELRKKQKEQKAFIEKYARFYEANKTINSAFKMRNRDTVNGLIVNYSNGHAPSGYTLGLLAQDGVMVEKDINAALSYFKNTCNQGVARACNNAGHIYRFGLAGQKDIDNAEKYLTKSALAGERFAIFNLAAFYFYDGKEDNIKAYLYANSAINFFDKKNNEDEYEILDKIIEQSFNRMTFFQHEYIKNYYPQALVKLLNPDYKKGKIWAAPVSMPQNHGKGIVNISGISPVEKPDKKTKKIFKVWRYPVSPRNNRPIETELKDPPALNPNSPEAVYGMMYRYDIPYQMNFALTDYYSSIVAIKGDKLTINVPGTVFANDSDIADEKNTSIRAKTTGISVSQPVLKHFPLPEENDFQAWFTYTYQTLAEGISEIIFERTDGEKYIVKVEVK